MKRLILGVLSAAFVAAQLFAGGSSASGGAASAQPLEVMMWTRDIAVSGEMDFYRQLQNQTGVAVNISAVNGSEWTTRLNLMFASGDYSDIILRGDVEVEQYGVDQKILAPLEDHVATYMPNYSALMARDPALNNYLRASDGHIYYTAWLVPQNINVSRHLFVNKLWLDNLGLAVPKTLAEFETMLRAFRDNDPNKNGQKDELPTSGIWGGNESILEYLSFWGIPQSASTVDGNWLFITDDNKVSSQLLHPNFRAAMETLNRWYTEGLIDIESLTQTLSAFDAKLARAQTGALWRWRMQAMLTPEDVVSQYVGILPVSAVQGVTPRVERYLELPSRGAYLTVACTDVARALKWVDAQYTFDNMANGYYGPYKEVVQEGATVKYGWQRNANGKVDFFSTDLEEVPNQSAIHFFSGPEYFEKFNMPSQRIEKTDYCTMYTDAGMVQPNSSAILFSLVTMSAADMAQRDLLKAQIDTFAKESLTNFISRGVTDASWSTFVSTLQNLRLNDYIRLYQAAYDRYLSAQN